MSKKKYNVIEKPYPLQMIEADEKLWAKYGIGGQLFEVVDVYKGVCKEAGHEWDESCYIPAELIATFADKTKIFNHIYPAEIFNLACWRRYKQIYTIDDDFLNELFSSEIGDIPVEIFKYLPYESFFVDCKFDDCIGFFCTRNRVVKNVPVDSNDFMQDGIHIYYIQKDGATGGCPITFSRGATVREAIGRDLDIIGSTGEYNNSQLEMLREVTFNIMMKVVQILLYICSAEADVIENPEQKAIYRKASSITAKDRIGNVRKWDVGYRIGRTLRRAKSDETSSTIKRTPGTSSPKRPHIRRAHFHHYWVGKRDSNERKLIVKWVAPMTININADETPTTIIQVK